MYSELSSINTLAPWTVTDGTDALLPANLGFATPGEPFVAVLQPLKAYQNLYAYYRCGGQVSDIKPISFALHCILRFPTIADQQACQQVELDLDFKDGSLQRNGGIAARFVGQDQGTWHTFNVAEQKWVTTGIALPPVAAWLAGVSIAANYSITKSGLRFDWLVVNGVGGYIGQEMAGVPTKGQNINVALQLDGQQTPKGYTVEMSRMSLAVADVNG